MAHSVVNCRFLLVIGRVAYGLGRPRDAIFQLAGKLLAGLSGGGIVGENAMMLTSSSG